MAGHSPSPVGGSSATPAGRCRVPLSRRPVDRLPATRSGASGSEPFDLEDDEDRASLPA